MTVWYIALGLGLVTTLVVGVLLRAIAQTAGHIEDGASQIWNTGQRIASNTVHVPGLAQTNTLLGRALGAVPGLAACLGRIQKHAEACPHCPQCIGEESPK